VDYLDPCSGLPVEALIPVFFCNNFSLYFVFADVEPNKEWNI
jgi:hypothetical protein